jgi:hypothetical protein
MDLAVDPQNPAVVYAAMGGFNAPHLWKSTDAGERWTDITGSLPDVPATAVAVDPASSRHLYAGTDLGVFASTDGGTSWNAYNTGLPEAVIVADLVISPSNRTLRLASHSNGVFDRLLLPISPVAVADAGGSIPSMFSLAQNYPNPFNPVTRIRFTIADRQLTIVTVADLLGKEVATLVHEVKEPGTYEITFDATGLASGIYLYRMTAGGFTQTKKMIAVK